jgi:MFS family permease
MKLLGNSGAFRALSYPDFFWFWSSYFVSNVGSWMQSIAQGWLLFELTSSPFYLGLFSSLRMVLLLCFFVLGGLMSDRWERRKVMLWIQVISALTALGLALLVSAKAIQVWHIFVLGAITSTTWAFEQPVRQALIPQLVRREDLINALALNAVVWNGAGLLGPSLVGLLVGSIGIDGCFYINVVSYLAVIAALSRMRVPAIESNAGRATVLQSLSDGFGYVRQEKAITTFLLVSAIFNIFGVSLFAFAASEDLRLAFACLVLVGGLSTVFETLLNTSIQLRVAEAYRGRVMGFYGLTGGGLRELGGMQAGFLAEWTSAPFAIEAGAVILVLFGLFFLGPRLRRLAT